MTLSLVILDNLPQFQSNMDVNIGLLEPTQKDQSEAKP
jgi:hypothetical protein